MYEKLMDGGSLSVYLSTIVMAGFVFGIWRLVQWRRFRKKHLYICRNDRLGIVGITPAFTWEKANKSFWRKVVERLLPNPGITSRFLEVPVLLFWTEKASRELVDGHGDGMDLHSPKKMEALIKGCYVEHRQFKVPYQGDNHGDNYIRFEEFYRWVHGHWLERSPATEQ